jgi:hypothetical protein
MAMSAKLHPGLGCCVVTVELVKVDEKIADGKIDGSSKDNQEYTLVIKATLEQLRFKASVKTRIE